MLNFPLLKTLFALTLMILLTFVGSTAMAQGADQGGIKLVVWGLTIDYLMVLSWCLVPIAWAITEYAPVPDDAQPMVPVVFGFIAATVGHMFFKIDVVTAQMQFAAALAAGNMNGFVKKFIPWVVERYRASRAPKENIPPVVK